MASDPTHIADVWQRHGAGSRGDKESARNEEKDPERFKTEDRGLLSRAVMEAGEAHVVEGMFSGKTSRCGLRKAH